MVNTLGFHIVKSAYGLWLPGEQRGHWSTAWDAVIGHTEPHTLHPGDPVRKRMVEERMKHAPVRWSSSAIAAMTRAVGECARGSDWDIAAATFEATHLHLLMTYHSRDIDNTCKWLAQRLTRAVYDHTNHNQPVFAKGKWCSYVFDTAAWSNIERYIDRHNERRGLPAKPYDWLVA